MFGFLLRFRLPLTALLFWMLIFPAAEIITRSALPVDSKAVPGAALADQSGRQGGSGTEAAIAEKQFEELPPPVRPVPPPPPVLPKAPVIPPAASAETGSASPLVETDDLPSVFSPPDLPSELQLKRMPPPRSRSLPKDAPPAEASPELALPSESWEKTPKAKSTPLLPEPDPDPGVIYVVPFISLMVPVDVQERIFDQFVDTLNERGAELQLKFVIFKAELNDTNRSWLEARKHVVGEIYGYVEESGCCSTELRTRVRLHYYRAHQTAPLWEYENSFRAFFDHDESTLADERQKLADQIVGDLISALMKTLRS